MARVDNTAAIAGLAWSIRAEDGLSHSYCPTPLSSPIILFGIHKPSRPLPPSKVKSLGSGWAIRQDLLSDCWRFFPIVGVDYHPLENACQFVINTNEFKHCLHGV